MRRMWIILAVFGALMCPLAASAECDQKEAQKIIKQVVNGGVATREDQTVTIVYTWKANWHSMTKDKQYSLAEGLGAVERCLRPGVTMRIRSAGRDVAKSGNFGTELLDR